MNISWGRFVLRLKGGRDLGRDLGGDLGTDLLGSDSEGGRIVDGAWEEAVKVVCDGGERTVWVVS